MNLFILMILQLHRAANLYFIFIVVLNMIIGAFGKYVSLMPISFVLGVTAIKDAFEVSICESS